VRSTTRTPVRSSRFRSCPGDSSASAMTTAAPRSRTRAVSSSTFPAPMNVAGSGCGRACLTSPTTSSPSVSASRASSASDVWSPPASAPVTASSTAAGRASGSVRTLPSSQWPGMQVLLVSVGLAHSPHTANCTFAVAIAPTGPVTPPERAYQAAVLVGARLVTGALAPVADPLLRHAVPRTAVLGFLRARGGARRPTRQRRSSASSRRLRASGGCCGTPSCPRRRWTTG
jgi:hypothetical protein